MSASAVHEICTASLQSISDDIRFSSQTDEPFPRGSLFASCARVTGMQVLRMYMSKSTEEKARESQACLLPSTTLHDEAQSSMSTTPLSKLINVPVYESTR